MKPTSAGVLTEKEAITALRAELHAAKEQIAYLSSLAERDPLTGLLNRRGLLRAIEKALDERRRYGRPSCLTFLDIDKFKAVNDLLGHTSGDKLLRLIAGNMLSQVSATEEVARFGGDEFVVVMRDTEISEAHLRAKHFRSAISDAALGYGALELKLAVSSGTVNIEENENADGLLHQADEKMYRFKRDKKILYAIE